MEKFRLAIFNTQPPHLCFGGVERRIMETTKRLSDQTDITVYSGTKAGFKKTTSIDEVGFVPCYSTDIIFPLDNWFFNRSLTRKVSNINADLYEGHAVSGYGFPKALEKKNIKKPFIHTIHGVLADEYEQSKQDEPLSLRSRLANYFMHSLSKLEEETAQKASLIVTISNYSLEKIQQHYRIEKSKVRIVPNGVDTEKFKPAGTLKENRRRFGLDEEPCVLFVGSLIPRKGLYFLVEAAKKIVKEKADIKFLIVGDGPLKNQLTTTLGELNLTNNFMFMGNFKDDMMPLLYNCADVFVLPSIQEGQGIVLLEAQASGKPVVAFDVGGVKEALRDGETGLLVEPRKSEELADALLKLLSDKSLGEKLGANGRRFVSENYTWDLSAKKMLSTYYEALAT